MSWALEYIVSYKVPDSNTSQCVQDINTAQRAKSNTLFSSKRLSHSHLQGYTGFPFPVHLLNPSYVALRAAPTEEPAHQCLNAPPSPPCAGQTSPWETDTKGNAPFGCTVPALWSRAAFRILSQGVMTPKSMTLMCRNGTWESKWECVRDKAETNTVSHQILLWWKLESLNTDNHKFNCCLKEKYN